MIVPADNSTVEEMEAEMDDMVEAEKAVLIPEDPISKMKKELAATEWLEDQLAEKLTDMKEEVYRAKIASAEQVLAKESGSPGTAAMLADMRLQMHALAAPFYNKVLDQEMSGLKAREKALLKQIEDAEENRTAGAEIEKEEEKVEKAVEAEGKTGAGFLGMDWPTVLVVLLVSLAGVAAYLALAARRV